MFSRLKQHALLGALALSLLGSAHASVQTGAVVRASQEASAASVAQATVVAAQAEATLAKAQATTAKAQLAQTRALQEYTASELKRARLNSERLLKMNPVQARRVAAVIRDLESHKLRPLIDVQVWRSPAQQAALVRKGYSKVFYSFHTVSKRDPRTGRALPDSLAADVVDYVKQWNAPREFWLKLNSAAKAHSSTTGIDWGLSPTKRRKLAEAIKAKHWGYKGELGWDVAHTQPQGLTVGQANSGIRPQ